MVTETTELKLCSGICCSARPLSEFRARFAGSETRHSTCRECHRLEEKARRQRLRQRKAIGFAGALVRANDRDEATRICRIAVAGFGGAAGFAKALLKCHESAEAGSPTAARILLAILHLRELTSPPSPMHELAQKSEWVL
jgi:hypothetical protein